MSDLRRLNAVFLEIDRQWRAVLKGGSKSDRLKALGGAVALVRSELLKIPEITADLAPLHELTIALVNAAEGKLDPLIRPVNPHKESGFRVRQIRGRAALAVDLLVAGGLSEPAARKQVSSWLASMVPSMKAEPRTIQDWRTDIKQSRTLPAEREEYLEAQKALEQVMVSMGITELPVGSTRKKIIRSLIARTAEAETQFRT